MRSARVAEVGVVRSDATGHGLARDRRAGDLDIAEVARRSGVPASTLRFYEEKRLIASIGRRGLRRLFDAGVLERLALIALGRSAGFTLAEIAGMFAADGRPAIDRQVLARRADALDETIHSLTALRDSLRRAVDCPAPSHMECPTFRRILAAAAAGEVARQSPKTPPRRAGRGPAATR